MGNFMTGAQAIVKCLQLEKVKHVFCVPGESYLDLIDAMYDVPDIQLVSARHEGGASFMAEAYGKATNNVGVAMATRGVGAANLAIGVHTAYQDSTPMVVFLGQVETRHRGKEGFQEVDLDQFFQHIAKWTVEIWDVERIPEFVQRAFRIAKSGRPGPVVVSLPSNILSKKAGMRFNVPTKRSLPVPAENELMNFFYMIAEAKKPIIIAGGGIKLSNAEKELKDFAENLNIPVISSFRRHDIFPNDHPLYVGHLGLGTLKTIKEHVEEADIIIALGMRFSEVTTQSYTLIKPHHKIIHLDINESSIGQVYPPDLALNGDAKATLQTLNTLFGQVKVETEKWHSWSQNRRRLYENITSFEKQHISYESVDMKEIIRILQKSLPQDSIITNDAGNFSGWLHSFYQFKKPKTYIGPTSGAMGYGLPAAIGAKLANREKIVVSLSGDGGFMMTMQELETAKRYQVPIIAIVFNNYMYGTIRMHQEKVFPNRVIGTDLENPDFMKIAEAFGVAGFRVEDNNYFENALKEAIKSNQVSLIEVVCDPNNISVTSTIESIRQKSRS